MGLIFGVVVALASCTLFLYLLNKWNKKSLKKEDRHDPAFYFFRHCEKPTLEPITGQQEGKIPHWLEGTLIRNGAGIMKFGETQFNHLFDGLSVLHRFHIRNGQVTYSSRPLESDAYKKNTAANRIVVSEFGTNSFPDPCETLFQNIQSRFAKLKPSMEDKSDNCNVNVAYYGDQLYAMTETSFVRRIDPETLKTVGPKTLLSDYCAINAATAHPHILEDGSILNLGTAFRGQNGFNYCIIKVPPTFDSDETSFKGAQVVAQIPFSSSRSPSYNHSFGLTKTNKIVLIESPLRLDLVRLAVVNPLLNRTVPEGIVWDDNKKTRFHVASTDNGKVEPTVYESDAFFTFHHINTYEQDDQIVVDVSAYPRGDLIMKWNKHSDVAPIENSPLARRYVLPLTIPYDAKHGQNLVTLDDTTATAKVHIDENGAKKIVLKPQYLAKDWIELPRMNYQANNGIKYNYMYGISGSAPITGTLELDQLVKIDIEKKVSKTWSEKGMIPGEPIFVPNPEKRSEDDGVILSALLHKDEKTNDKANLVTLLILDAKSFEEISRATFKAHGTVTGTFHGQWAQNGDKLHFN